MYEKAVHIERFMTNRRGNLSLRFITFLLSDIMEKNADSYGASAEFHHRRNLAWVLTEYDIDIHSLPKKDDTIYVGTLPYSFKRMFGYRIYHIRDKNKNILLEGKGKFVLINFKTKALVKPSQDVLDLFTDAKKEPCALPFEKLVPRKDNLLYTVSIPVLDSYIDVNNHVNNAYYVAIALERLNTSVIAEEAIKRLKVYYKKEAVYEDQLRLDYYLENNGIYIEISTENIINAQIFLIKK